MIMDLWWNELEQLSLESTKEAHRSSHLTTNWTRTWLDNIFVCLTQAGAGGRHSSPEAWAFWAFCVDHTFEFEALPESKSTHKLQLHKVTFDQGLPDCLGAHPGSSSFSFDLVE